MTTFKTELNVLIDKSVKNITVALFDFEKFNAMTQEQIDTYLEPDRMMKDLILKKCENEVAENQDHIRLLKLMLEKYGDKEPTGDIGSAIREAFDRAVRERADTERAQADEARASVSISAPDDRADQGVGADSAGDGGHRAEQDTSDGSTEDAGRRDEGNPIRINRVGVE